MKNTFNTPKRKNIRLKNYDYSKEGMYYITICTQNRVGKIVEEELNNTNKIRKNVKINSYVIMPNHIHMIIEIIDAGGAWYATQDKIERSKMLISKIIQQIKTITIKRTKQTIELEMRVAYHATPTMAT